MSHQNICIWLIGSRSDVHFHDLYPSSIQQLAPRHWTPLNTVRKVIQFLAPEGGVKVLDIGSGVGKFCLSAACYKPDSLYYRVEQRENLVEYAETAKKNLDYPPNH